MNLMKIFEGPQAPALGLLRPDKHTAPKPTDRFGFDGYVNPCYNKGVAGPYRSPRLRSLI